MKSNHDTVSSPNKKIYITLSDKIQSISVFVLAMTTHSTYTFKHGPCESMRLHNSYLNWKRWVRSTTFNVFESRPRQAVISCCKDSCSNENFAHLFAYALWRETPKWSTVYRTKNKHSLDCLLLRWSLKRYKITPGTQLFDHFGSRLGVRSTLQIPTVGVGSEYYLQSEFVLDLW